MTKRMFRNSEALLCLVSLFVLMASLYFEYLLGMQPCPLCMMQRLCVFLVFSLCLTGLVSGTLKRAHNIVFGQMILALAGLYFAGRQLWLQSLPPDATPACVPGLDVLLKFFPWKDVAYALFWGSGECGEITWSWLGLSMPAWSFLYFLFILLASFVLYWRLRGRK